jgi:hypothetical protein
MTSRTKEFDMVKTKATIRYVSGRSEEFEVDLFGGSNAEARLKEFMKDPTIVLQTDKEVVIIPASAIETITLGMPEAVAKEVSFPNVRKAKRVK